jgi:stress-induced morphogen
MKHTLAQILMEQLDASHVTIKDDSAKHAGHRGIATHTHTHFALTVISEQFEGTSLVQRHRNVYNVLQGPIKAGVHAIQITAKTPKEAHNV